MTGGPGAARKVAARALNCPNCGAALTVRAFEHTLTVVCGACQSVLDAKDPSLRVLQRFAQAKRVEPKIPLGARGTWRGATYEVIGFQRRTIHVDGTPYSWDEYLLFNPFAGFRYLTEYEGHWNDVTTVRAIPQQRPGVGRPSAALRGQTFRHFQTADAKATYVLGEFPWQVRVGDRATVKDFIAPPRMLSLEETGDEKTWSLGEYVSGAEVWEAFRLPGSPPPASGVFANQPSPHTSGGRGLWNLFFLFVVVVLAMALWRVVQRPTEVVRNSYQLTPGAGEPFVTPPFALGGRTSSVEVRIDTDLENSWAYFNLALLNENTGTAIDFGREVSYYHGVEDGEAWHEGSRSDRARIPSVPPGRYYLRVDPELPADARRPVRYTLTVRRDVPAWPYFAVVLVLLAIPPATSGGRAAAFEAKRWAESDYAPSGSSGDDE